MRGRPEVPRCDALDRRGIGGSVRACGERVPGRRQRRRSAGGRGLFCVASLGPIDCWLGAGGAATPLEGAVPPRRGETCAGGPVGAWSLAQETTGPSILGPAGGTPKKRE
ncbi:hypothetical protein NDU88_003145 [Pleurodeles waltl]|uniref:Uncharacterized protein n=1 Tax=Pleurodeles waltl TaxID=8319 RepID=A0AAV7NFV1_PLEWA|nr:hypothetical protein NDU88_003145 [Pleurodeles waltl]